MHARPANQPNVTYIIWLIATSISTYLHLGVMLRCSCAITDTRHVCSLLQGYGIGYFWWAVCHILCFAGAFFTILAAEAWGQVGQFLYDDGFVYWGVNALRLLALFVGGMGFPALLIFPLVAYKR